VVFYRVLSSGVVTTWYTVNQKFTLRRGREPTVPLQRRETKVSPTTPSFLGVDLRVDLGMDLGRDLWRSHRRSPDFIHTINIIRFTRCIYHIVKHEAICDGSARGRAQEGRGRRGTVGSLPEIHAEKKGWF
jgi:hypothetical protein